MKETTYKDTDLREALRRKYADTPQLPADFMAKMQEKLDPRPVAKTRKLWSWLAAVACILLLICVGVTVRYTYNRIEPEKLATHHSTTASQTEKQTASIQQRTSPKPADPQPEAGVTTVRNKRPKPKLPVAEQQEPATNEESTPLDNDPNLHYASHDLSKTDTVPYQDPARVDEFITKFANYYKVKEGELTCSAPKDGNVVSAVYVFPDTKDVDVFSRLLQAACWYSDETPGYLLNFSHQQFFFELKDMRKQLQYRWIAERINGKILLYSTHAPLGTKESSTCYQEYRDELMHIKSINNKTRKI